MTVEPVDLFRLGDADARLVARVFRRDGPGVPYAHDTLVGEWVIDSSFASGRLELYYLPDDLSVWESAIAELAAGRAASWMHESGRTPELHIGPPTQYAGSPAPVREVVVADAPGSGVTMTFSFQVPDDWIQQLRAGLAAVRRRFPRETMETSPGVHTWLRR